MKREEQLARSMRERALQISGYKILTDQDIVDISEELKQLYFHAGRWSGGARDWKARKHFEQLKKREDNADINN